MFVNVARRDQVLLNRQLSFIDSLERAEEDPSTLANLFRLDHLATRMRRNAESLLVLAGIDSGRRLRDAMPLSDVVRTASSEIEQYDRVELDLQVDPHMHGFNALGAAHMLAELLENATIFSEPETPVTVTTGVSGQFVVVRILDQGLGMSDAELEAANSKIISTSASDSLGNQRLGLFVVGRIAQRLGADVRLLKAAHGTGTETIVRFPATLFVMTETNLYGNGAPAALAAPRNDPGLPQIEAPVVEEVDLAALTDGQTSLGLPHRRRRDDGSDEPVGPIPVTELAQSTGLPSRSKKTFDEDNLVLPEAPDGHIAPEISAAGSDWKPATVAPLKGGLPSRSRASTSAWAKPEEPAAAARRRCPPLPLPPVPVSSPASADAPRPRPRTPARTSSSRAWCPRTRSAPSCPPSPTPSAPRGCRAVPTPHPSSRWSSRSSRTTTTRGRRRRPRTARRRTSRPPRARRRRARPHEAAPVQEEAPAWEPTPAWDTAQVEAPAAEAPGLGGARPPRPSPPRSRPGRRPPPRSRPGRRPSPRPPRGRHPSRRAPAGRHPSPTLPPGRTRPPRETPVWDDSVAAETPAWEAPAAEAPAWDVLDADATPALGRTGRRRDARPGRRPPPPRPRGTRRPSTTSPPGRRRSSASDAPAALTSRSAAPAPRTRSQLLLPPRPPHRSRPSGRSRPTAATPAGVHPPPTCRRRTSRRSARSTRLVPGTPAPCRSSRRLPSQLPRRSRPPVEPVDEQAPAADDSAWPAPAWEPPTWQSPEWAEQPAEAAAEAEPVVEPEPEPELAVVDGVAFRRVYLEPDPEAEPRSSRGRRLRRTRAAPSPSRRRRPRGPLPRRRRRRRGRRSRPRTSRSRHRRRCSRRSRPQPPSSRSPHRRHPSTRRPRSRTPHPRPPGPGVGPDRTRRRQLRPPRRRSPRSCSQSQPRRRQGSPQVGPVRTEEG